MSERGQLPPSGVEAVEPISPRDRVLYAMSLAGWANVSNGESLSPHAWFAVIKNSDAELSEILDAFEGEVETAGLSSHSELIGNFMVIEDATGLAAVIEYPSPAEVDRAYAERSRAYSAWFEKQCEVTS
jgi:hypothetical protein